MYFRTSYTAIDVVDNTIGTRLWFVCFWTDILLSALHDTNTVYQEFSKYQSTMKSYTNNDSRKLRNWGNRIFNVPDDKKRLSCIYKPGEVAFFYRTPEWLTKNNMYHGYTIKSSNISMFILCCNIEIYKINYGKKKNTTNILSS